ncbi:hypothetical protein B6D60_06695 [candidate division KSB1 bacterium 4484_87]|nr:MAG: hypothetical protein B6D60_06695 [candidate division KSB1 bacterium 4484_87]
MKKRMISFLLLIPVLFSSNDLWGQIPALLQGEKIRVTSNRYFYSPIIANFEKSTSDSLFFSMNTKKFAIPISEIQKIETSFKKRNTTKGIIIGAIPAAVLLGAYFYHEEQNAKGFEQVGQPGLAGGILLGLPAGGALGGLIGNAIVSDHWKEIYPHEENFFITPLSYKSPILAFTMSALIPGLGQFYNGDIKKGIIQEALFLSGILIMLKSSDSNEQVRFSGFAISFSASLWSMIDAPRSAIRKNKQLQKNNFGHLFQFENDEGIFGLDMNFSKNRLSTSLTYHF